MTEPTQIALNDLREQMPATLARLAAGERFIVTKNGRFVALLAPIADLRRVLELP